MSAKTKHNGRTPAFCSRRAKHVAITAYSLMSQTLIVPSDEAVANRPALPESKAT